MKTRIGDHCSPPRCSPGAPVSRSETPPDGLAGARAGAAAGAACARAARPSRSRGSRRRRLSTPTASRPGKGNRRWAFAVYHRWAAAPGEMVAARLREALGRLDLFGAVFTPPAPLDAGYRLSGAVRGLWWDRETAGGRDRDRGFAGRGAGPAAGLLGAARRGPGARRHGRGVPRGRLGGPGAGDRRTRQGRRRRRRRPGEGRASTADRRLVELTGQFASAALCIIALCRTVSVAFAVACQPPGAAASANQNSEIATKAFVHRPLVPSPDCPARRAGRSAGGRLEQGQEDRRPARLEDRGPAPSAGPESRAWHHGGNVPLAISR